MGFITVLSQCAGCRQPFMYNPSSVPSITVGGWRKPICRRCIDHVVNPARIHAGLDPIVPLPDAYDPCDESELPDLGDED